MYRVLIADDEPIERTVIQKTIQKYFADQLEVYAAENGREAVAMFQEHQCHIAILDIEMPGVNGLEAASLIREKNKTCSIIFLTAFDEFSYAKHAISVRALDYLLKPGSDEELIAVLEEAIRLAKKYDEDMEESKKKFIEENEEKSTGENRKKSIEEHEENRKKSIEGHGEEPGKGHVEGQETTACEDGILVDEDDEHVRIHAVKDTISNYIRGHYQDDISLQDVAQAMNYSDAYFCKLFKQIFDKSFTVYLTEYRVGIAKELLADVTVNIKDISYNVGYRDSNYFAKVFKRNEGVTPSEYRIQVLKQIEKAGAVR